MTKCGEFIYKSAAKARATASEPDSFWFHKVEGKPCSGGNNMKLGYFVLSKVLLSS